MIKRLIFLCIFSFCCAHSAYSQPSMAPAHAPHQNWSFLGATGSFNLTDVQNGYLVYKKICASCHTLTSVHFSDLGGMGLTKEQVLELAKSWNVIGGFDGLGHPQYRPALPSDPIPNPYLNKTATLEANGGVIPPDLSRIIKIYPGGADRLYGFLLSFDNQQQAPWHNPYVIGHFTAMPPPFENKNFQDCRDITKLTQGNCKQARDVTTFLTWLSYPSHDARHRLGIEAAFYLIFIIFLIIILKRRIWSHVSK